MVKHKEEFKGTSESKTDSEGQRQQKDGDSEKAKAPKRTERRILRGPQVFGEFSLQAHPSSSHRNSSLPLVHYLEEPVETPKTLV